MLAPTKMTAAEKEAQISEIRSAAANKRSLCAKFQGSFEKSFDTGPQPATENHGDLLTISK